MTLGAADTLGDVDAVIEENVVRQRVDPRPADRDVVGQALTVGRQHRGIGPDLGMAGHADRRGRHSRIGRLFDCRMTIAAVDPEPTDMVLVTEGYRLFRCKALLSVV